MHIVHDCVRVTACALTYSMYVCMYYSNSIVCSSLALFNEMAGQFALDLGHLLPA